MNTASTPASRRILLCCDGTAETGLGHVSRCLALAEALEELGCGLCFAGKYGTGARALLASAGMKTHPLAAPLGESGGQLAELLALARSLGVAGVVLDSYGVSLGWATRLAAAAPPLLVVDDFGALNEVPARVLLNFTVGAEALGYAAAGRRNLLGPGYFLARRRLRRLRRAGRAWAAFPLKVCVCLGGVDRFGAASVVLHALSQLPVPRLVRTVVSMDAAGRGQLEASTARFGMGSGLRCQPPDLAEELAWADVCICGGGLIKYEAAYVGVPGAVLSQTAQQDIETAAFAGRGLAHNLGLARTTAADTLTAELTVWLGDEQGLATLRANGWKAFPEDPTIAAAAAFLKELHR